MAGDKEYDALTGTDTTGHEWDGIKELNTPLPRWWLYTFYVTIVWAVIYAAAYPAIPTFSDYSKGFLGYSSRAELTKEMAAAKEAQSGWRAKFEPATVEEIAADRELQQYAMAGGRVLYGENCQPCHASAGAGAHGYPALVDDDWLWGGTLKDIETTIRVGARAAHDDTRESEMPAFGTDEILTKDQIAAVSDYVLSLSSGNAGKNEVFEENCAACHGEDGKGVAELGGPNLADAIWLYGSSKEDVVAQVTAPKHGVMPTWEGRLDDVSIKLVTVYVHSLGGGQ